MQDKELLELAAKAAGLTVHTWEGHTGAMCAISDVRHGAMWMPLRDDGDALRLAVNLKMRMGIDAIPVGYVVVISDDKSRVDTHERIGVDPYAATRRAIVRAAAEIGKAMP